MYVDVEPILLFLGAWEGHVALSGGDDNRLAGGGRPELLAHVHLDGEDISFQIHFFDKNLLIVVGIIRNFLFCVKILCHKMWSAALRTGVS
jgi:hypothetical protein